MGEGGFEPPATWSQTRNHTKLDHPPIKYEGLIDFLCINNEKFSYYMLIIKTKIFFRFLIFLLQFTNDRYTIRFY